MKFVKSMITLFAIAFLILNEGVHAESSEDIIKGFQGVKPGSANANICQEKCTGDGAMSSGTCSDLNVYMACKNACNPVDTPDCQKAAEKEKYYGLVQEIDSLKEKYKALEEKYNAVNAIHQSSETHE